MKTRNLIITTLIIVIIAVFASCNKKNTEITGISTDKTNAVLMAGNQLKLIVQVHPDNATNTSLKWFSDNESIVTVNQNGIATGVSTGMATITCITDDGNFQIGISINVIPNIVGTYKGSLLMNDDIVITSEAFIHCVEVISCGDSFSETTFLLSMKQEVGEYLVTFDCTDMNLIPENGKCHISGETIFETYPIIIDGIIDSEGVAKINIYVAMTLPMNLIFQGIKE